MATTQRDPRPRCAPNELIFGLPNTRLVRLHRAGSFLFSSSFSFLHRHRPRPRRRQRHRLCDKRGGSIIPIV